GAVRRLHLNHSEHIVPVLNHRAEDRVEIDRSVTDQQSLRLRGARGLTKEKDTSMVSPATRSTLVCSAQQGSRPAPTRLDRGVCRVSAAGLSSVPCRPRNSRRSAVHCVCLPARSANATYEPNSVLQGLWANIAPVAVSIAVTMNGAEAA